MKPKKRQPLDFSMPVEEPPPAESVTTSAPPIVEALDVAAAFGDEAGAWDFAEASTPQDPPHDLDLEISEPSLLEPGPVEKPETFTPRARGATRRSRSADPIPPVVEPEPKALEPPVTSFAKSLATSSIQAPTPVSQPEVPVSETAKEKGELAPKGRRSPPETFELPPKSDRKTMPALVFWAIAVAIASLWALAPVTFAMGYARGVPALKVEGFALIVFAGLAIGPALLTLLGAYMLRQAQGVASELRRSRILTDRLVTPAVLAAAGASGAVEVVRAQIDYATASAEEARERILALRQALAEETAGLVKATAESVRMADQLARGLGHEREALETLSLNLDTRSTAVVDAIGSQARMVAEASDLAETQLREAEAALAARAADLAAAAAEASDAARVGAEDISRQIARLETAGQGLGDQMSAVEKNLAQQRAALVAASQTLRSEQEDFAAETETRTAQLTEFVAYTRVGATELNEVAAMGAEMLRGLISAAADQVRTTADLARSERDSLTAEAGRILSTIADIAAGQREGLEVELRQAMEALAASALSASEGVDARVAAARSRVDQLNEIAFAAGQKADTVFESRMEEARDLIEQSAQMVEQAGARTAQKLTDAIQTARNTLIEFEAMLSEVGHRTASLPDQALQKALEVRASIEQGIEELMAASRRTAEEATVIDQAFQERVRRSYEALSEAAVVMAGSPAGPRSVSTPGTASQNRIVPTPISTTPPRDVEEEAIVEEQSPRPRLRLTPTATDDEFRSVFEKAGARLAPASPETAPGTLSWKSLLSSLESKAPAEVALGETLAAEILGMGIDPNALLPRGRIDEIAATIHGGAGSEARDLVKRLAPAAIRRLVRRLFSDAGLRGNTERFLKRYEAMIAEASGQDREGFLVAALLSSDAGRVYLLLDAASGDLG